jgi:hypothetical protein
LLFTELARNAKRELQADDGKAERQSDEDSEVLEPVSKKQKAAASSSKVEKKRKSKSKTPTKTSKGEVTVTMTQGTSCC